MSPFKAPATIPLSNGCRSKQVPIKPGHTLLDDQTATWDRTKAFPIA